MTYIDLIDDAHESPHFNEENLPPVPDLWPQADESCLEYVYVVETLSLDPVGLDNYRQLLSLYGAVAEMRGWQRVFASSNITGDPTSFTQVFQITPPYPGAGAIEVPPPAIELGNLRQYHEFVERLTRFERTVLAPMPYDPGAGPPVNLEVGDVLLAVSESVRDGAMNRLSFLKQNFFIDAVKPFEWQLIAAGYALSGPGSTLMQLWKVPDPRSLPKAMNAMGHNPTYRKFVAPCIAAEAQDLCSSIFPDH